MKTRKPAWWALYSLLPLGGVLFVAVSRWIPAGAGRLFAEAMVSLAILGGMALWVRLNRIALAVGDAPEKPETLLRARVAYRPPAPRRHPHVAMARESEAPIVTHAA